jgi:hypothetical protein
LQKALNSTPRLTDKDPPELVFMLTGILSDD